MESGRGPREAGSSLKPPPATAPLPSPAPLRVDCPETVRAGEGLGVGVVSAGLVAYLLLPGHPLVLLRGVPLDALGLGALVALAALLFAFGCPRLGGRTGRLAALAIWLLVAGKLLLWLAAPSYGLEASYYPRARIGGAPEPSAEYRGAAYTRIELSPGQPGLALHFFNDIERFNFYEATDPSRTALPFAVRWEGFLHIPRDGTYPVALTARGTAVLSLDGAPVLTVGSRGDASASDQVSLNLSAGAHPLTLDLISPGLVLDLATPAVLLTADLGDGMRPLSAPTLTTTAVDSGTLTRDRVLSVLAILLDVVVLAGIAALVVLGVWRVWPPPPTPPPLRGRGEMRPMGSCSTAAGRGGQGVRTISWSERPLLAALVLVFLVYALITTAPLAGRAVILEGGQDWLTYESYARDILLNGPLMTLGEPLGRGKPFFFQPFYPYYLAGLHWLAGEGLWGPVVLQLTGLGVAGVALYFLAKRLFGLPAAVASLLIYCTLCLTQLDWIARKLLSENLYFIVLPLSLVWVLRAADERHWRDVIVAGLLLGVAAITRAPTLLFVPGVALVVALCWRRGGHTWRVAGLAFVVLGLATASVATLVPLRNQIVAGRPALVATNGGATLLLAHQPSSKVRLSGIDRDPLWNALRLDRPTREVAEFIRQDPLGYAWTLVPLGLYSVGISGLVDGEPPVAPDVLTISVLYLLALLWLPAARTLRTVPLHLFIAIHLAIMMTFLPYVYGYRQVLPMQLLMLVFGGALLARLVGRLLGKRGLESQQQPLVEQRPA